ncbi:MAG: ABC transporter permease subunit [Vallitalea sp.]|jgi:ABC-type transport system involved in multi-copper enzyme maturation permease subunit|nr:ABC transporter permease subunit [Vallitalea sp.]
MYQIFKLEIKRKLKSPVVWILVAIMMLLLYVNIDMSIESNEMKKILDKKSNQYIIYREIDKKTLLTKEYKEKAYGKNYEEYVDMHDKSYKTRSLYNAIVHNYDVSIKDFQDENYVKINKTEAFDSLLDANYEANSERNKYSSFSKYLCDITNKELWDRISDGVKYEDIDFKNEGSEFASPRGYLYSTISNIFKAKRYYYLYNNDLIGMKLDEFNNLNILNDWINSIVPIIIIIISILLNYNLINKDVKEGSTKLLITQSIPRWKYYIGKFIASTIVVIITVIIPLFISNIYIKTQIKTQPINYPIVYDKQGIKTFEPSFNYIEKNFEKYEKPVEVDFYKMPYSIKSNDLMPQPLYQRNINLIGFNKFLILTFLYSVLFIMFMVAFVQLCSAILNNVYLSLLASTAIYGLFYFLFKPFLYGKHYNLCPFTMNNGARIVAGTHNVTMLTALLVLGFSTIILLLVGVKYFKKKGI